MELGSPPVQVFVKEQSIIDVDAEVIVVPRTPYLEGGMVAKLIESKGGSKIQKECKQIMKKRGEEMLQAGEVVVTSAGKLHCEALLNAVSYSRHHPPGAELIATIAKTAKKCLEMTESMKCSSIALPAISGGDAGHPRNDIAIGMAYGVKQFCEGKNRHHVKRVLLVDIDEEQIELWKKHLTAFTSEGNNDDDKKGSNRPSSTDPMGAIGGQVHHGEYEYGTGWISSNINFPRDSRRQINFPRDSHRQTNELDMRDSPNKKKQVENTCPLCMNNFKGERTKLEKCGHTFCKDCIDQYISQYKAVCPTCGEVFEVLAGTQPYNRAKRF